MQLLLLYGTIKSYGGWKRLVSVETVLCPYFRSFTFIKGVCVWINSKQHFLYIQEELERISITVETLQLWAEKMLAAGVIDEARYEAYRSRKKT